MGFEGIRALQDSSLAVLADVLSDFMSPYRADETLKVWLYSLSDKGPYGTV